MVLFTPVHVLCESSIAILVSLVTTNFVNSVSGVLDECCYVYSLFNSLAHVQRKKDAFCNSPAIEGHQEGKQVQAWTSCDWEFF
jgi:hypothetical protein